METSFTSSVSAEKIMNLLNSFKEIFYNVNYLNKLITQHTDDIYENRNTNNGYTDIITPFVNNKYIYTLNNTNNNTNRTDFFITSITTNINNWDNNCNYYSSRFPQTENILFTDPLWKTLKPNLNDYFLVDGANRNKYKIVKQASLSKIKYLNKSLELNSNLTFMYQLDTREDPDGVVFVVRCLRRDILYPNDPTKWISISSSAKLIPFFENATNYMELPILETLAPTFNIMLQNLEATQWNINNPLIENAWEFSNITNIDNTRCLYSKKFPNWNDQLLSNCYLPDSNLDVQKSINGILNDLYYYYPSLEIGEIGISTYNNNGTNILSICKIDTYNSRTCIKNVNIDISKLYTKNTIVGDTVLQGDLTLENIDGNLLSTDSVTNTIVINGKLGLNQNLADVQGILDIDNLSIDKFQMLFDSITDITNTSYNVSNDVKNDLINNGNFTISNSYLNDIVIFKVPVLNKIEESNIDFKYVPPNNILKNKTFTRDSFLKIQKIVNEINRMKTEIENYYDKKGENLVMSFIELLHDTEYYYTCSLKAILINNEIYFIMSFTLSQDVMIRAGYRNNYEYAVDLYGNINKLINFAVLVFEMPGISDKILQGELINGFTKYIQDSEFSDRWGTYLTLWADQLKHNDYIHKDDLGIILFNEYSPEHNLKNFTDITISKTDNKVEELEILLLTDYRNRYGFNKKNQNFGIKFLWNHGTTIAFVNVIDFNGSQYFIGADVDLMDILGLAFRSNGDNSFSGNISVQDAVNNSVIFEVNTGENKVVSMYNTGIGTEFPTTKLDINDCGITEILNTIADLAERYFSINLNVDEIIIPYFQRIEPDDGTTLYGITITASQIEECANRFINVKNFSENVMQTKDNYYYLELAPTTDIPDDLQNVYNWLYRNWDNTKFTQINNENDTNSINNSISHLQNIYKHNYLFNGSSTFEVLDWVFGTKITISKIVQINGIQYQFGNGINLGNYDVKYNSNKNILDFYDYVKNTHVFMQNMIFRIKNISESTISNFDIANDYFNIYTSTNLPSALIIKKIVVNFNDTQNAIIGDLNFTTFEVTNNVTLQNINDVNFKNKYNSFFINLRSFYSNNGFVLINNDYSGIVNYEDIDVDFVGMFYCLEYDSTNSTTTLIVIEKQINQIIKPSLDIKGDFRVSGDAYFHDKMSNTDFVSIDTNEHFMGIGTNDRYANYSNNLLGQNCIVSNNKYPVFISERISEVPPTRDISGNIVIDNTINNHLVLFANKTSLTARRKSNFYTIDELKELSTYYTETSIASHNFGNTLKYRYGADINFEIMDKTLVSRELGNIHMVIDSIENNNIKAGFGVSVLDTTSTGSAVEREIMYVNNDGVLHVEKIALGEDGDILTIQKINDIKMLYINNTPIAEIN